MGAREARHRSVLSRGLPNRRPRRAARARSGRLRRSSAEGRRRGARRRRPSYRPSRPSRRRPACQRARWLQGHGGRTCLRGPLRARALRRRRRPACPIELAYSYRALAETTSAEDALAEGEADARQAEARRPGLPRSPERRHERRAGFQPRRQGEDQADESVESTSDRTAPAWRLRPRRRPHPSLAHGRRAPLSLRPDRRARVRGRGHGRSGRGGRAQARDDR